MGGHFGFTIPKVPVINCHWKRKALDVKKYKEGFIKCQKYKELMLRGLRARRHRQCLKKDGNCLP